MFYSVSALSNQKPQAPGRFELKTFFYGSEVKTTPFEFALTWVSFITAVWLCDGLTLSLVDWLVLASSNSLIQEVCVVYLLSLVTVWVPGLRCLRTVCLGVLVNWDEKKKDKEREGQRHKLFHLTLLIPGCVKWCNWQKCVVNINCLWRVCYKYYTVFVTCNKVYDAVKNT